VKIAQIAPVWYPIPPTGYGGIELVVSLLADGLVDAGHDVTVFASGDSKTKAKLEYAYEKAPSSDIGRIPPEIIHMMPAYLRHAEFDLVHDHSGKVGPAIGNFISTPVLHTLHGPFTEENQRYYRTVNHGIWFNSISDYQASLCPDLNYVGTIYNSVNVDWYPFSAEKQDYLLWLGRMNNEKGAEFAVEVANRLGARLILASKMTEPHEFEHFENKVKPILRSNTEIVGELTLDEKSELIKNAKAVLMPIQWPEPFGLVMIEAMVCGTPCIAWRNGSVPEVIQDGKTGFIVESVDEMVEAVGRLDEIDPAACRAWVEERFSAPIMVANYVKAYERILGENHG
jgi:glycosyltransferase involved in cell wall biosynthesis